MIIEETPCIYQLFERMFRRGYENFTTFLSLRRVSKKLNELADKYTRFDFKRINITVYDGFISLFDGHSPLWIGIGSGRIIKKNGFFDDLEQEHNLIPLKLIFPKDIDDYNRDLVYNLLDLMKKIKI